MAPAWLTRLATESGLTSVVHCSSDVWLLIVLRFVRLFAYGASFLVLVPLLAGLGIADARIGLFMTLTLLGDTAISVLLAAVTDRVGRRRILAVGAMLMAASGAVFAISSSFWVLLLASIVGVISPSGNEIGPFRAIEESVLAHLTEPALRSDVFAWYTLSGTAGAALGSLTGGCLVQLLEDRGDGSSSSSQLAYRAVFFVYAAVGVLKLLLTLGLSPAVELEEQEEEAVVSPSANNAVQSQGVDSLSEPGERTSLLPKVDNEEADSRAGGGDFAAVSASSASSASSSPALAASSPPKPSILKRLRLLFPVISAESRRILSRLILLFALDSFGSGMASASWITYFFITVHSLAPAVLGTLFLVTSILAAVSNLLALPLARRLGPLRTMVFTHLPSTILLAMVPLPSPSQRGGTTLAMAFLALRSCTQSMDQAPRQAFLAAAVLPAERTAVMGAVNMVKTLMQAAGVGVSGVLAGKHHWILLLSGAGALKATYDLLLLWSFTHLQSRGDRPAGGR
ncbi:major facilitator superfamily transporter [Grosmannia clavigera kw1407]|uniref:Major facilitator superfamily transporter n=1 Tax=Grosmannia clavigera (strain kw1407 / UAMH 11150) TaxID=655863 RepID=F0XBK8_GROCL|nr:major facilitator superfamily transporter [Grosmannia clavigera kw1407]EFX05050.1 major facilitator superfamily transporter [Grosmannia clavigera kw1407]